MIIQWLGHACFVIESGGYRIVIDPYEDHYVPGLRPLSAHAHQLLCSHDHRDHGCADVIKLEDEEKSSPFTLITVQSDHDHSGGAHRGHNTIHVLKAEGFTLAHLGDLGCELNQKQLHEIGPIHTVMVPIGGYYTIDASEAKRVVASLSPTVVIPMHYRSDSFGFHVLGSLDAFTDLCNDVKVLKGDTIALAQDMPKQTAILQYC